MDQKQWDNQCDSFEGRYDLNAHTGWAALTCLKAQSGRTLIVDHTRERKALSGHVLLALGLELAQELKRSVSGERVGIVLPPGAGAFIANLACFLSGKIPVNLNFTFSAKALNSCIETAGLDTMITAEAVKERATQVPWARHCLDIATFLQTLPKTRILWRLAQIKCLPVSMLANLAGVPCEGGDKEAALLFTSGSSGEPKGVPLTHRNILGNCYQIADYDVLHADDSLMGCLPVFHSFGFTVTICFPMVRGLKTVYLPSPLETTRIAQVIEQEQVTVHLGTPTLFRPYLKKVKPAQLRSLRAVVAGAEKTLEGFHERWESRFGSDYLEGYGLTETTPVVACNIPGDGKRRGSVGKLFPGMAARIVHAETLEPLPLSQTGLLSLKGVNVFGGYMDLPEANAQTFRDGWFVTGDLARLDEDGFIYVEGRLSRFSKIGGEMIPHGTVETLLMKALDIEESEEPVLAVSARPDEAKGEALVLLITQELSIDELRKAVEGSDVDLPNMWLPREIRKIDAIPVLGSGKLDIKALAELATK